MTRLRSGNQASPSYVEGGDQGMQEVRGAGANALWEPKQGLPGSEGRPVQVGQEQAEGCTGLGAWQVAWTFTLRVTRSQGNNSIRLTF